MLGQEIFSLVWSQHGYLLKGISRVSCIAIMFQQRDKADEGELYEIENLINLRSYCLYRSQVHSNSMLEII